MVEPQLEQLAGQRRVRRPRSTASPRRRRPRQTPAARECSARRGAADARYVSAAAWVRHHRHGARRARRRPCASSTSTARSPAWRSSATRRPSGPGGTGRPTCSPARLFDARAPTTVTVYSNVGDGRGARGPVAELEPKVDRDDRAPVRLLRRRRRLVARVAARHRRRAAAPVELATGRPLADVRRLRIEHMFDILAGMASAPAPGSTSPARRRRARGPGRRGRRHRPGLALRRETGGPGAGHARRARCPAAALARGTVVGVDGRRGRGCHLAGLRARRRGHRGGGVGGRRRPRRHASGPRAAAEAGVALERFAVVRRVPPARWATVVAALLDGMSLVIAEVPRRRARSATPAGWWPGRASATRCSWCAGARGRSRPRSRVRAAGSVWRGARRDAGVLTERRMHVRVEGRGAASRPRGALARARGLSVVPSVDVRSPSASARVVPRLAGRRRDSVASPVCATCRSRSSTAASAGSWCAASRQRARERVSRWGCAGARPKRGARAGRARRRPRGRRPRLRARACARSSAHAPARARAAGRLSFPTRGPSRYFGGDDALAARVLATVQRRRVVPTSRVGIADGGSRPRLAARAACRRSWCRVGESPAFLAPWPVACSLSRRSTTAPRSPICSRGSGCAPSATSPRFPTPRCSRASVLTARVRTVSRAASRSTISSPAPAPPELVEVGRARPAGDARRRSRVRGEDARRPAARRASTSSGCRAARWWSRPRPSTGSGSRGAGVTRARSPPPRSSTACAGSSRGGSPRRGREASRRPRRRRHRRAHAAAARARRGRAGRRRQLGFWGGDAAAHDRAARVLARLQGMLGHDAVSPRCRWAGARPAERVRWVPWGEPRDDRARTRGAAPWPGAVPGPVARAGLRPARRAPSCSTPTGSAVAVSGAASSRPRPRCLRCAALPTAAGRSPPGPGRGSTTCAGGSAGPAAGARSGRWWSAAREMPTSGAATAPRAWSSSRAAAPRSKPSTTDAAPTPPGTRTARVAHVRPAA